MPNGSEDNRVVGVDVGAVSVSAVEIASDGKILRTFYELHNGDIEATVREIWKTS